MKKGEKTEMEKCRKSMAYFAEKYCTIKTPTGIRAFQMEEIAMLEAIEKARKSGKGIYILKGLNRSTQ